MGQYYTPSAFEKNVTICFIQGGNINALYILLFVSVYLVGGK